MKRADYAMIASAMLLAAIALLTVLLRPVPAGPAGPRGPQGSQGQAGRSAEVAHLGVCVAYDSSYSYVASVSAPVITSGVPSCPSGTFVPIVPQP